MTPYLGKQDQLKVQLWLIIAGFVSDLSLIQALFVYVL